MQGTIVFKTTTINRSVTRLIKNKIRVVGFEPTLHGPKPSILPLYYTLLLIKAKKGIEPLLQILQTYTLPLCYLTSLLILKKILDPVGSNPHTIFAKHLLYQVGAMGPLHPVRVELTFLP